MAHDVFISYATDEDSNTADEVVAWLEKKSIKCWIAPRDITAGIEYAPQLLDGIYDSRLILLVLSSKSNDSQYVMREIERAVSKGIPILTFRIENVQVSKAMEFFLSSHQWVEALTQPLQTHLEELTNAIKGILAKQKEDKIAQGVASGKEALAKGEYSQARRCFEQVLILDSENKKAASLLEEVNQKEAEFKIKLKEALDSGKKTLGAGNYDQARKHFEKARKLDPNNQETARLLEQVDRLEKERKKKITEALDSGKKALGTGDYDQARKNFEEARKLDGNNQETIGLLEQIDRLKKERKEKIAETLDSGKKALDTRDYDQARKHFEEVRKLDRNNQETIRLLDQVDQLENKRKEKIKKGLHLGKEALVSGYYDQAKGFFKKVLQLAPKNMEALGSIKFLEIKEAEQKDAEIPISGPSGSQKPTVPWLFRKPVVILSSVFVLVVFVVGAIYLIKPLQDSRQTRYTEAPETPETPKVPETPKAHEIPEAKEVDRPTVAANPIKDTLNKAIGAFEALKLSTARKHFEEVLEREPDNEEARSSLERIDKIEIRNKEFLYLAEQSITEGTEEGLSQAEREIEEVLKKDIENREAINLLKKIENIRSGKTEIADEQEEPRNDIEKLLASAKDLMKVQKDNKDNQARKLLDQVFERDPGNETARSLLNQIEERKDQEESTEELLAPAEKRHPQIFLTSNKLEFFPKSIDFGKIRKEDDQILKEIEIISNLAEPTSFELSDIQISKTKGMNINGMDFFIFEESYDLELIPQKISKLKFIFFVPQGSQLHDGEYNGELIYKETRSDKEYSIPFNFIFKP